MSKPLNVVGLLALIPIEERALPSNLRYGSAIHNKGAVEFITNTPTRIEAWVGGIDGSMIEGGGSRRRVEFIATKDGLKWHCTGNPKNHQIFCKHCVGLALTLGSKY